MPDNTKSLNVRLKLKYDSYENWHSNNPQLLAGEVAVVYIPTDKSVDVDSHVLAGTQPPHILMKVGDGTNKFDDLQWVSAKAADVNSYAKLTAATFETQIKALASAELSQSIRNNADAIDALEALVGSDTITTQIANAITALDLANTYAAKEHTHTKADITDFNHTHEIAEVNGLQNALDGKQAVGDYATKTEAQGYADAKDEVIAAAKKAGDDAKASVNELAGKIGEVDDGQTVMGIIKNIQESAYDDTELRGLIGDNAEAIEAINNAETGILKNAKDYADGIVENEKERAEGIESGLRADVDAIKGDYLKSSDKEALQTQIDTIINNPDTEGVINSINEFTQYINDHGEIAEGFRTDIDKNKEDIAANAKAITDQATADAAKYETKDDASAKLTEAKQYTDDEIAKINQEIDGIHTHDNKDVLDGISAEKVAAWDASEQNAKDYADGKASAAQSAAEAKAAELDSTLKGELEGKINAIDNHSHTNKDVLDGISAEKVSAWDSAEQNAKAYADSLSDNYAEAEHTHEIADVTGLQDALDAKANDTDLAAIAKSGTTDDLAQGAKVLIFDCGTSAI